MPRDTNVPRMGDDVKDVNTIANLLLEVGRRRAGPDANYAAQRAAMMGVMADAMWVSEETQLQALVSTTAEVTVGDLRYRRLGQKSSATYHGLWGTHVVEEPLYRQGDEHNGPTLHPLEVRVGMLANHVLPDAARTFGLLAAYMTSTESEGVMGEMGFRPPGRAFLERRVKTIAGEMAAMASQLDEACRKAENDDQEHPEVAAVSCGLDRMAVQMDELLPKGEAAKHKTKRRKPYQRAQPPPAVQNWRMAWVASVTTYARNGDALHTTRYGTDAGGDRDGLVARVKADIDATVRRYTGIPVLCIQDGAKDLTSLPTGLRAELTDEELAALPTQLVNSRITPAQFHHLTDFEHLMGYLDNVVNTCEPAGDPRNMKLWYRSKLLHEDDAIDRILVHLRWRARNQPSSKKAARAALAKAIKYIRKRRKTMRYASLHQQNLPIGSGATESTCALMQLRVKRPGMAWKPAGLRATMTIRGFVLSDRWDAAWAAYAATKRKDVGHAQAA